MKPAEWLAVVGSSGSGKSTLLRAIMGLKRPARPTTGHMQFDGAQWHFADKALARPSGIAFVPQSPAHGFDPLRRLRWQMAQLKRRMGREHASHEALFNMLGLPDLGGLYPHEWSRGMQQRLLLAMALMSDPKLLILDEPTSALDLIIAAQVLEEVRRIVQDKRIAVMMVTHDLALGARYADNIAIMEAGHLVEFGPSEAVIAAPKTKCGRELVAHRHWHSASPVNDRAAR